MSDLSWKLLLGQFGDFHYVLGYPIGNLDDDRAACREAMLKRHLKLQSVHVYAGFRKVTQY